MARVQIYTKILLGMGVGTVIGLTLGPTSTLLEHDTYLVDRASKVTLLADPHQPSSVVPVPAKAELRLDALETRMVLMRDKKGEPHELPGAVKVRFEIDKRMALLDKKDALKTFAADPETGKPATIGDTVEAWLMIEHIPLDGGGFVTSPVPMSGLGERIIYYIAPIGDIFMRLLKMVIVPLVFSSLLVGVASLGDIRKLGRLGSRTLGLYLATTAVAVSIGLACAALVRPGDFVAEKDREALKAQFAGDAEREAETAAESKSVLDNIVDIIPTNPIASLTDSSQMLSIIFFAIIFAIALTLLKKERSEQVVTFMDTVQHAMIVIIHMVMAIAPFGVAALLAEVIGESGISILKALVVYAGVVVLGLALHTVLVYGSLVRFVAKLPLLGFFKAIRPAQLIGFSTSSSSASLPVSMECAEENLGVSKSVSSFVLPLGSTVNMDGTALYQGVAAVFIAQVFGMDLSVGTQLGIVLTATAASIGAAGVPGAGMVTLAMVLTTAGIPAVGVALILGVDRILDMFRTAVNITGDLSVTSVMAVAEGERLNLLTPEQDEADPRRGFEHRLDREPHKVEPKGEAED